MTALTPTQLAEAIERAKKWLLCRAGEGRGYHTLGAEALLHQTAKLEAAREALDSYADHREECASNGEGATEPPCDCGFDAALASLPSAPAATPTRTEAPCCECGVSMMRPNQHCKYPGNHPAGVLDETALADWLAGRAKDWGAPQLAQASAIIRALTKPASAPAKTPPAPDVARMVNRFLGWRLPKPWHPDNGISYKRPNYGHAPADHDWPTGTNLFDAEQAKQMIEYMLEGSAAPAKTADEAVQHLIDICCTIGCCTIPAAGSGYGLVKEMLLVDLDIAQAAVQLALKSTTTKD